MSSEIKSAFGDEKPAPEPTSISPPDPAKEDVAITDFAQDDPQNPRNWTRGRRLFVSLSAICAYFVIVMGNSIYIASIPGIETKFGVSLTLALLGITLYSMGFVPGPAFATALSEEYGRQHLFKISILLNLVFTIVGGSAKNFRTIAVSRALAGLCGSPCVGVLAGVINDLWDPKVDADAKTLTLLAALYGLAGVFATEIGPVSGESIVSDRNWRWSFWLHAILLGFFMLLLLPVPETYRPEILRKRAKAPRGSLRKTLSISIRRPLHMIFVEPIILPTAAIVTIGQVVLFVFYAAYPLILQRVYNFSFYHVGLAFLPVLVGSLFTLPILGVFDKRKYQVAKAKAESLGKRVNPEERLYGAMLGGILLPISLFWLAWTARKSVHWIAPILAGIPFGLGFGLTQIAYPSYKNDVYGSEYGASSLAADTLMRYAFSCTFPLYTVQMIDAMKFEWAISMFGFILLALVPVPWVIYKWGPQLRARSQYTVASPSETV